MRTLRARGDLHAGLPSMRCVGYRQAWQEEEALGGLAHLPGSLGNDAEVQAAIDQEVANLADDVKDFKFYPVVQLSLGWRF